MRKAEWKKFKKSHNISNKELKDRAYKKTARNKHKKLMFNDSINQ